MKPRIIKTAADIGIEIGREEEREKGLKNIVDVLENNYSSFEDLYEKVASYEEYAGYSREQVAKYCKVLKPGKEE